VVQIQENGRKLYSVRLMNSKRVVGCAFILWARIAGASDVANPAIGMVVSAGDFQVDGFHARGNGTLLNGTTIDTLKSSAHVSLSDGTRFDLAPDSHGQVFPDRLILKEGITQVWPGAHFSVVVNQLRLHSDGKAPNFRAARLDEMIVSVTSVSGIAAAQTLEGTRVAQIAQGETRQLANVMGLLGQVRSHYLMRDEGTLVMVEVQGPGLRSHLDRRVKITGVVDAAKSVVAGVSLLIDAVSIADQGRDSRKDAARVLPVAAGAGIAVAAAVTQLIFTGGGAAGISPGR
jgi:hypothetical protein